MKKLIHSAPGASGNSLCGLPADCKMRRTCHTPDQDVLEKTMKWCGWCQKAFKKGKLSNKGSRIYDADGVDVTDKL